ncbi:MAG: transaldolase [Desulfosarcinaceae bacterium]|nr:transaldolase [Desulfosarcinaceae bacterium]
MTKLHELAKLRQSVWYDNISRSLLDSGELSALLDAGVVGVTSNPTIFQQAITGGTAYDPAIGRLAADGRSAQEIYEELAIADIQRTADLLRPLYDRTNRGDGYVSLEVNPGLAHDTAGTVAEARRLKGAVNRPNVMIKVPATPAGVPAIRMLTGEGINVNVTLIFGLTDYAAVADAYISGLEILAGKGGDLGAVASVASFFVSRVDTAVDAALASAGHTALQGCIAIANAKVAYARFNDLRRQPRWRALAQKGARVQRLLWASTGVKNPAYADTRYLDDLIGAETVNTVPPATLEAFLDHGSVRSTLTEGQDEAAAQLSRLAELGIDLASVTQTLQDEGVAAFAQSFEALIAGVRQKRDQLRSPS